MKHVQKIFIAVMALTLAATLAAPALAVEAAAGSSGTAELTVRDTYGIDGTIELSDPDGILTNYSYSASGMTGAVSEDAFYLFSADMGTATITIEYTVRADAAPGSSCAFVMNYSSTINGDGDMEEGVQSVTLRVPGGDSEGTGPAAGGNGGAPAVGLDYSGLEAAIERAEELFENDYTMATWKPVAEALRTAWAVLYDAASQTEIDNAAAALDSAVEGLARVDRSALQAAVDSAILLRDSHEFGRLWTRLLDALQRGVSLLQGNDQDAMNETARELEELIAQLQNILDTGLIETEVPVETVVEKEAPQEVLQEIYPDGPYCAIWPHGMAMHWLLPVLVGVSLAGNVVLIVVLAARKRREPAEGMSDDL